MSVVGELISNVFKSTPQGYLGVTLIFLYFILILGTALYRIKKSGNH